MGTSAAASAQEEPRDLTRYARRPSIATAVTIALKSGAYLITGSVGLLSDAAESVVNLVAAFVALIALHIAARPPDEYYHFGHTKAEYFSAAVEGVMILVAAVVIIWAAALPASLEKPSQIENVGVGLLVTVLAPCSTASSRSCSSGPDGAIGPSRSSPTGGT